MGKETPTKHYPVADLGLRNFHYTDAEKASVQEQRKSSCTPFFTEECKKVPQELPGNKKGNSSDSHTTNDKT